MRIKNVFICIVTLMLVGCAINVSSSEKDSLSTEASESFSSIDESITNSDSTESINYLYIKGIVKDDKEKLLDEVTINLDSTENDIHLKCVSNNEGEFNFYNLTSGNYIISISELPLEIYKPFNPYNLLVVDCIDNMVLQLNYSGAISWGGTY